MFGFPGRGNITPEQRVELQEYLRDVLPVVDTLEEEFTSWLSISADDTGVLSIELDPDGQHAAVYLWRVVQKATDFVSRDDVVQPAKRFHEAFSLCLEARGSAADYFKEAADLAPIRNPSARIAEANKKLLEARKYEERAKTARQQLEALAQDK